MKLGHFAVFIALACPLCAAQDIVMLVQAGGGMPITEFRNGVLVDGFLKDFGDALARQMHFKVHYLSAPRKRVEQMLGAGGGDLLCDLRPEWLDGKQWLWSEAVYTNNIIIASRRETPAPRKYSDLEGQRIGTLLGYRYPEVEAALGARFVRNEAPNDDQNVNKLLHQRFDYILSNSLYYDYQRKVHPERQRLNAQVFQVVEFDTYCTLPPHGKLALADVNRALDALKQAGVLKRILARFQPSETAP